MPEKSALASYATSVATAGVSYATAEWHVMDVVNEIQQWSAHDWLSAIGILVGIIGVCNRAYTDIVIRKRFRRGKHEG